MSNPFDFTDVTGVPEELVKRMNGGGVVNPWINIFATIVEKGAELGHKALSLSQIEFVAIKMDIAVPKPATIRNALNAAVKANRLVKVTRQTYGVATPTVTIEVAETAAPVAAPVVLAAVPAAPIVDETDPLA